MLPLLHRRRQENGLYPPTLSSPRVYIYLFICYFSNPLTPTNPRSSLLPLITRRDTLSLTSANLSNAVSWTRTHHSTLSRQHRVALLRNTELAQQLVALEKKREEEREKGRGEEYRRVQEKWKVTKGRWEVVRQVAQGIVVGSGVDWARDGELREWVVEWGDE